MRRLALAMLSRATPAVRCYPFECDTSEECQLDDEQGVCGL
jgi:hypothetical protein